MSGKNDKSHNLDKLDQQAIRAHLERKRLGVKQRTYSSEQFQRFKAKIGEEIERTGALTEEFVDELKKNLRSGEL